MGQFKRFYLWGMNMKLYMGIYFAGLVFICGLLVALSGGDSLRLVVLLQMLLLSMGAAMLQVWLLPTGAELSRRSFLCRAGCWLAVVTASTIAVSLAGNWFVGLPNWYPWLLGGFMFFGGAAMLFGIKWEQDADTLRLNDALQQYQKK